MTSFSFAEGEPAWTRAIELDRLRASGRATVKLGAKQLALFLHDGTVHACNNRCPHEGYPLVEGALDAGTAASSPATGITGSSTFGPAPTTTAATACASIR
jgi:nitrite reductase/ring-hydroxylating ferredoxin subunit